MRTNIVFFLLLLCFNLFLGGYATEYVVEFWGAVAQGVDYGAVDVPFWLCVVAGLFFGQFTVPLAVLTWLLSFVIL